MPKPASRPALRFLIPALLFIGLAVFLLRGLDRNPQEIPSPLIGKPAPAWRMTRLTDVPPTLGQKAPALPPAGADAGNTAASPAGAGTVATAQGTPVQLDASQLKGAPYILNIWASWCMPCLEEHPQFLKLAEQHPIRVVGLNYKDKPDDARRWLRRNGNPFDDILQDERGRTAIDFGVYGVPETFLIDGAGNIRFKHVGAVTPDVLTRRLLPAIESLKSSH